MTKKSCMKQFVLVPIVLLVIIGMTLVFAPAPTVRVKIFDVSGHPIPSILTNAAPAKASVAQFLAVTGSGSCGPGKIIAHMPSWFPYRYQVAETSAKVVASLPSWFPGSSVLATNCIGGSCAQCYMLETQVPCSNACGGAGTYSNFTGGGTFWWQGYQFGPSLACNQCQCAQEGCYNDAYCTPPPQ
jgi:hypothetical protein